MLIEKNSHFHHLFAFPRFAVTNEVPTQKAFIPYLPGTFAAAPPGSGTVLQAKVVDVDSSTVKLDRKVSLDDQLVDKISYEFLVGHAPAHLRIIFSYAAASSVYFLVLEPF